MEKTDALLIDAGTGNLHSVYNALKNLGFMVKLSRDPRDLPAAPRIILPGVGAFGGFMQGLTHCGLAPALQDAARRGIPLLGICVGMQALFTNSTEMGLHAGLNILPGEVLRFNDIPGLKIPHTGWNQLWFGEQRSPLFRNLPTGCHAYFNHAYYCRPQIITSISATTDYVTDFAAAIHKDNIFGVQFHPEKSQRVGQTILQNFFSI